MPAQQLVELGARDRVTTGPVCITCGDVAVPMRVERIDADGLAWCTTGTGEAGSVEIALLDRVAVGDTVLVHACVALQVLEGDKA